MAIRVFNRCIKVTRLNHPVPAYFLRGGQRTNWPWWFVQFGHIEFTVSRVRPRKSAGVSTGGNIAKAGASAAFLALIVAANVLTSTYGLIPVGLGLMATAGTWCAGLVLLARDWAQDLSGRAVVIMLIAAGAAASAVLAGPQLALASGVAFAISEVADLLVYTPLRRKGWARAALASNLVGALVDTLLFLAIAGFPIWQAFPGQMFVKTAATVAVVAVVVMGRAVLRYRVRAEGV